MGDLDDYLVVKLYEEEGATHSVMNLPAVEKLLAPQIKANIFPDGIMAPDKCVDFREFDDTTSHTLYFWDNKHQDFEINLMPGYFIKVSFLNLFNFCQWFFRRSGIR